LYFPIIVFSRNDPSERLGRRADNAAVVKSDLSKKRRFGSIFSLEELAKYEIFWISGLPIFYKNEYLATRKDPSRVMGKTIITIVLSNLTR